MRYQLRYIRGCKSPLAGASVRDTGIEPVTSSVSGKRATAALIAPMKAIKFSRGGDGIRTRVNGFAGRCLASRPRHHAGFEPAYLTRNGSCTRADDETRTRDPHLGKVMRYQLRYIRISRPRPSGRALGIDYPRSRDRPNQAALPGVSAATTVCDTPGDHPCSSTSPISCTMNSCATRRRNLNMGVWRSWLARFLHTEEVVGSSPASPTTSSLSKR